MNSLSFLFLALILALGIIELLRSFTAWAYKPITTSSEEKVLILKLKGHQENIEYIIRSIIFYYSNHFPKYNLKIICLNLGLDQETKKICKLLSQDFNCVYTLKM